MKQRILLIERPRRWLSWNATLLLSLALPHLSMAATSSQEPKDWMHEVGASADALREKWAELTGSGTNLIAGKPVIFNHEPAYALTADDHDPYDLTDEKLSGRQDDRIWYTKDAVAWLPLPSPVTMMVDLGSVQPIGRAGIRLLGGAEQPALLNFPRWVEVIASEDGQHFFSVEHRSKLNPAERELHDEKKNFYLEEPGRAYVYPFLFDLKIQARYVGFRVSADYLIASDEMVFLEGDKAAVPVSKQGLAKVPVILDGLLVLPKKEDVVITTGALTPNWMVFQDSRPAARRSEPFNVIFEVPEGMRLLEHGRHSWSEEAAGKGRVRYTTGSEDFLRHHFSRANYGPFYFEAGRGVPPAGMVRMSVEAQGFAANVTDVGYRLLEVPQVPPLRHFHVSLAWMGEAYAYLWPDFLKNWRWLGFNAVSFFPRYYVRKGDDWDDKAKQALNLLEEAREAQFAILYNESPFHYMLETMDKEANPEVFSQVGGKSSLKMSPLYRGELYQKEIERVGRMVSLLKPDYLFHDIELFYHSVLPAKADPAIQAAREASGKTWEDFLTDQGREMLGDLRREVARVVEEEGLKAPLTGLYNLEASRDIFDLTFSWKKSYPGLVDFSNPSLYLNGNLPLIRENIRANYKILGEKKIIPWLTAGTYGEFAPPLMEPMLYELFLNGGSGVTYYEFTDFDPEDYYYQAQALKVIAEHEPMLWRAKPQEVKSDRNDLFLSMARDGSEALLLVGNYLGFKTETVRVELPFGKGVKVTRLRGGEGEPQVDGNVLTLKISGKSFGLYRISAPPSEGSSR